MYKITQQLSVLKVKGIAILLPLPPYDMNLKLSPNQIKYRSNVIKMKYFYLPIPPLG